MNPKQFLTAISISRVMALSAALLLATIAFMVGRWTAPVPIVAEHYVTTPIPHSALALVTETHSGRVRTIKLTDTINGKVWSPSKEKTGKPNAKDWQVSTDTTTLAPKSAVSIVEGDTWIAIIAFILIAAIFVCYMVGRRSPAKLQC